MESWARPPEPPGNGEEVQKRDSEGPAFGSIPPTHEARSLLTTVPQTPPSCHTPRPPCAAAQALQGCQSEIRWPEAHTPPPPIYTVNLRVRLPPLCAAAVATASSLPLSPICFRDAFWAPPDIPDVGCESRVLRPFKCPLVQDPGVELTAEELQAFAGQPLAQMGFDEMVVARSRAEQGLPECSPDPPFTVCPLLLYSSLHSWFVPPLVRRRLPPGRLARYRRR